MAAVVIFVSSDEIFFLSDGNYFLSAGMHASSFSTCKGTATIFGDDANWGSKSLILLVIVIWQPHFVHYLPHLLGLVIEHMRLNQID